MNWDRVTEYLILGIYVAAVYMLVRPQSTASTALAGLFASAAHLATLAVDF